jgi:nucleoid-associated protein YgaU
MKESGAVLTKKRVPKQQGSSAVTREHKLALIVGFSLILLVGVLISDHLSSARQAQVGDFGPGDFRISEAPLLVPTDPLHRQDSAGSRAGLGAAPQEFRSAAADDVPMLPSPVGVMPSNVGGGFAMRDPEPSGPVVINQSERRDSPSVDPRFAQLISNVGGVIQRGSGGIDQIVLPPAAKVEPSKQGSTPPQTAPAQEFEWYTVKPGERLYKIAEAHLGSGNRWREIQSLNSDRIDPNGNVRAGVKIRVPKQAAAGRTPAVAPTPANRAPSAAPTPTPVILGPAVSPAVPSAGGPAAAPATGGARPGQPAGAGAAGAGTAARPTTYTVQRGDTLGVISQKTLGTARRWREIAELNNIDDEDHVPAGRVLKIPAR